MPHCVDAFSLQAILAAGQSWPQALRGASCADPGTLVWGFYMHPILGAMLILLFSKPSVNPLTILCAFGVPRLNYTCFFATETNLFPALSLQLVPPYARPNSLSFACGNLTLAHVQARCKS